MILSRDEGLTWIAERVGDLTVRLRQVRLPSLSVPSVSVASVDPTALVLLERSTEQVIREMIDNLDRFKRSLSRMPRPGTEPLTQANRVLSLMQLKADELFKTLDLFQDAMAVRSDAETAMALAGADRVVAAALGRNIPGYQPPLSVSYLDSAGRGGAIMRARTRLPGGVVLPLALIRVSPETLPTRLTSSLHEAGHQLGVDLNMLDEARAAIEGTVREALRDDVSAQIWGGWTGELVADLWSLCLGGGAPAVDGLQRVLSLPAPLLYIVREGEPHPPGMVRVAFALAFCRLVHPDLLLDRLEERFSAIYGNAKVPQSARRQIAQLAAAAPAVAKLLARHRFNGLGRATVPSVCDMARVSPIAVRRLLARDGILAGQALANLESPLTALAVIGTARLLGRIDAKRHDSLARIWLKNLARKSHRERVAPPSTRRPVLVA